MSWYWVLLLSTNWLLMKSGIFFAEFAIEQSYRSWVKASILGLMKKLRFYAVSIAILCLSSCGGSGGGVAAGIPEYPRIFTTAQAERRVEPNMARIEFAVLTRAPNADKAREENAVKTTALMDKIKSIKIPAEDIETLDYRIQEVFSYQNGVQKVEAYEVVNRMQLRILDVKNVGKVIDQLVPLGANKIENVSFDVAEKDEIYRELLEEATTAAREKALRISDAAGLGKITVMEVREEYQQSPVPMYKFAMVDAARSDVQTQLSPTTVLKASISLTAKARE